MDVFEPRDPTFAERVRASFARERALALIGARLGAVRPGEVEIVLAYRDELSYQEGVVHSGIIGMIADAASRLAAYSLMPPGSSALTVEYKLSLAAPASGVRLLARGRVLRPGRTLVAAEARVMAVEPNGKETLVAASLSTLTTRVGSSDQPRRQAG